MKIFPISYSVYILSLFSSVTYVISILRISRKGIGYMTTLTSVVFRTRDSNLEPFGQHANALPTELLTMDNNLKSSRFLFLVLLSNHSLPLRIIADSFYSPASWSKPVGLNTFELFI